MALPIATAQAKAPLEVLLAEDGPVTQSLLRRLLTQRGHNVDAVDDGEQALEALQRRSYDIGLMDFHLPQIDGLSVAATFNALRKDPGGLPYFIGITSDMEGLLAHPGNCDNFDLVIPKPIDIVHLCSVVEDFHHYMAWTMRDLTELEPPPRAPAVPPEFEGRSDIAGGRDPGTLKPRARRIKIDSGTTVLTLRNGRTYDCRILDLSLSGASIEIEVRPPINERVRLGRTEGRVARHTNVGIAVEFARVAPLLSADGVGRTGRRAS